MDISPLQAPPPEYSSSESAPCPSYSPSPRPTERTVQCSVRPTPPSGIYIKRMGEVTVLVFNQEEDAEHPSVGLGGLLAGSVLVDSPNVKSVLLKIEGLVELAPVSSAYLPFLVLETTQVLYSGGPSTESPQPQNFSFEYSFPRAFLHNRGRCSLPPTFNIPFGLGHFVRGSYRVTVSVSCVRQRVSFLSKNQKVSFKLDYRPRSRPLQPMISNPSLFDTIKYCPEEWKQLQSLVSPPNKSPLMCDLFAPSRGMFCVNEVIPFHLQLSGDAAHFPHIHRFFMGTTADPCLRVYIRRQISVNTGYARAAKELELGEGTLQLLGMRESKGKGYLNWEGQVRCGNPKSVMASFDCGYVSIQDALVVEMISPHQCAFKRTVFGYGIGLTTDRWDAGEQQQ